MNALNNKLKLEWRVFLTAIMFYTRLPVPRWVDHSEIFINKSTRYFPLVGWIVGGFAATVFYACQWVLPPSVSVTLSMAASIWVTGAFHEDGFADVCDGFGGGWTKARILAIMKDSVVGAFGVVGLAMILLLKYLLLYEGALVASPMEMVLLMVSAHSLSRFAAITMIHTHHYVRENDDAKAKPVAKKPPLAQLVLAGAFGVMPMLFFQSHWLVLAALCVWFAKSMLGSYFNKWIGGYTGDCLGATQQVCEVVFYLGFLIVWKFI